MASSTFALKSPGRGQWGSAQQILEHVELGDLLEFNRRGKGYNHWAIYVGNKKAIHVFLQSKLDSSAKVIEEPVEDISEGDSVRINNLTEEARRRGFEKLDVAQILKNAKESLNTDVAYHVLNNNCEYFVTACRYGQAFCVQVENRGDSLLSWGTMLAVGAGVLGAAGAYLKSQSKTARQRYNNQNNTNANS